MERKRDSMASASASQRGKRVKQKAFESESRELEPSFADLPSDITSHILLQLPIKSVIICKCVCTTWNALISDPHFAKLHFEHAPVSVMIRTGDPRLLSSTLHLLEFEPGMFESECNYHVKLEAKFKLPLRDANLVLEQMQQGRHIACEPREDRFGVLNSCNGFLCLCDPCNKDPLVVCNPVTGEFIRLPETPWVEKTGRPLYVCAGFGFQPKTNEYKVIRMWKRHVLSLRDARVGVVVEMHTLGTPKWRNVGVDPRILIEKLAFPTCVNGALHWISFDGLQGSILCFNFESESFQSFPSPPHVLEDEGIQDTWRISMVELSGFLYICDASSCGSCIMWVMKKYGIGESWTKVFSIDYLGLDRHQWPYGLCWPVKHFKSGAAILMQDSSNSFVYYEYEKYGFQIFWVRGTQSKLFEAIPLVPSLISLKDAVKGNNVEVLNVHSRCAKFKLPEEEEVLQVYTPQLWMTKNMVKKRTPPWE